MAHIEHHYPATLFDSRPFGFTQVVVSEARRLVYCSGQTAWNEQMQIVGAGELRPQLEAALENLRLALAEAGAEPRHVVQMRTYVVDYSPNDIEMIGTVTAAFFDPHPPPACTVLGVQALALPDFLVEIDATAALD